MRLNILGSHKFMGLILAYLALTACTDNPTKDTQTLVVALSSSPATLDPRFATDANGMRIADLLFNSLVKRDVDLNLVGDAAQVWEYKKLEYNFVLKEGLSFSNGQKLSKEDIEFSFNEYLSPSSPFKTSLESIKNIKVIQQTNGLHIIIQLKYFTATLLSELTAVKFLPKTVVEKYGKDFNRHLEGTGSFKLEHQKANEILLSARSDHPWAAPKVKKLLFKIIGDDNTRYLKTLKGDIDISQSEMPPTKVKELEMQSDLTIHKYPGLSTSYLIFNLKDKNLKSLKVRQAIAHAIDRDEIIKYKLEGLAIPATAIITPVSPFHNATLENLKLDPEKSRRMIEILGLKDKAFTLKTSNNKAAIENGKVISNQLSKIGLNIKLQNFEWGTFYSDIKKGNFQMATMRWVGIVEPDTYRLVFHSQEFPPGKNRGYYVNVKLDKLLDQAMSMENSSLRIKAYQKIQKIVLEDLPIIPLWHDTQVSIVRKRVQGYIPPKNSDFSAFSQVSKR